MSGAAFNRGKSKTDYATPDIFMAAVVKQFGPINFDLAAHAGNAKHANYFTEKDDSLQQEWNKIPGTLWLNPPYDSIRPWAAKCWMEAMASSRILFLVPASVGANWFRDFAHRKAFILALNGRMSFDGVAPYPKDLILACYGWGVGFDTWTWKQP